MLQSHPSLAWFVEVPLYLGKIPGAIADPDREALRDPQAESPFLLNVSRPTLRLYLPEPAIATGAAVVICPGGGYLGVSIEKEGYAVAEKLNAIGVAAAVLKYRNPDAVTMEVPRLGPLQDAQQAIATLRRRGAEWRIDARRLGIMGFSAGGHLAATAATRFQQPVAVTLAGENLRPDFLILVYPVISMLEKFSHAGSRQMLLGDNPATALMAEFSAEKRVTGNTPATFLVHSGDDGSVPVENSLAFYRALREKGVTAELHIYPAGGHGYGLDRSTSSSPWFGQLSHWLSDQGWLEKAADVQ